MLQDSDVEGMDKVSSGEDSNGEKKSSTSRSVHVKQNGETITIDDAGKDEGTIVKEVLENMTIKIDNIQNGTEPTEPEADKESSVKAKKKDRKDRRESVKSRVKSGGTKDLRDIGDRLKAQASYGEEVELDYDDINDEARENKAGSDSDGEIMVSHVVNTCTVSWQIVDSEQDFVVTFCFFKW